MPPARRFTSADVHSGASRLAEMYPALRFGESGVLDAVQQVAEQLGEDDGHVPDRAVDQVVRVVDRRERRRLLALAEHETGGSWTRIQAAAADLGCIGLEGLVVAGTAAASIAERRTPPAWIARHAETAPQFPPAAPAQLAILLRPESVWSIDDAYLARARSRQSRPFDFSWAKGARREHVERLRARLEPVESCLPVEGAPRVWRHSCVPVRRPAATPWSRARQPNAYSSHTSQGSKAGSRTRRRSTETAGTRRALDGFDAFLAAAALAAGASAVVSADRAFGEVPGSRDVDPGTRSSTSSSAEALEGAIGWAS